MRKLISLIGILLIVGMMFGCGKTTQSSSKSSIDSTVITTTSTKEVSAKDKMTNEYMKKNNIILTSKDVQFDMKNNLDKDFAISGLATLSDYYNYGFKDDKNYFCIKINTDDTVSNSWYLYCDRTSFSQLFNDLKSKDRAMIATCKISKNIYKSGQGNMAEVMNIEWDKGNK